MSKKTKKTTTDSEFYNDANRLCDALRAALDYIQEPCGRTSAEDHEIQDNALDAIAAHDRLLQKANETSTIKPTAGHTFEVNGAVLSTNQEYKFGSTLKIRVTILPDET